jgi:hypothetical protein
MYLEIFGRDAWWVLYRDIHLELYGRREKGIWERKGKEL